MLTPETLAELRRLMDECQPGRVTVNDLRPTHNAIWLDSRHDDGEWETRRTLAEVDTETETVEVLWGLDDAVLIAAAINALPDLLDAAAFLDEVRAQVARGALCPMCSTGMTRQTVGMVCQLCGTDYTRPEYASLRRDSEQTTKAALAEALAVRAERDALAAKVEDLECVLAGAGVCVECYANGWHKLDCSRRRTARAIDGAGR